MSVSSNSVALFLIFTLKIRKQKVCYPTDRKRWVDLEPKLFDKLKEAIAITKQRVNREY